MSKRSKPIPPREMMWEGWESARPENDGAIKGEICYLKLADSLLKSKRFLSLAPMTQLVFIHMLQESKTKRNSKDRREFTFPQGIAKRVYGIQASTLRRAVEELVENRIICKKHEGALGEPNIYYFNRLAWREDVTEEMREESNRPP